MFGWRTVTRTTFRFVPLFRQRILLALNGIPPAFETRECNNSQPDFQRSSSVIKLQKNILAARSTRCAETIGNHLAGNVYRLLDRLRMPMAPPDQVPFDVLLLFAHKNPRSCFVTTQASLPNLQI